jgi:hypothetical protein
VQELSAKVILLHQDLDKMTLIADERDLEISRLRRENEEQNKKNKSLNEKIMEYQKTNEKQRKDMAGLQEIKTDLERQFEMQKIMTRNALMERDYDSDNSS